jgi:hypothetical protein
MMRLHSFARVTTSVAAAALALAVAVPGVAAAADLSGEWSSVEGREGVRAGGSHHDLGDGDAYTADLEEVWTFTIEDVDGNAFHAEWCSPNKCEDAVGVMSATGTLYAADEDGVFHGTLLGGTMELCYLEPGEDFRVVDCHILEKR